MKLTWMGQEHSEKIVMGDRADPRVRRIYAEPVVSHYHCPRSVDIGGAWRALRIEDNRTNSIHLRVIGLWIEMLRNLGCRSMQVHPSITSVLM
jgi:hypothetical protein